MAYQCAVCGQKHEALPDLGFTWPDYYFGVPEDERESRVRGNSDTCRIDEYCFVRGVILMPLIDRDESFGIGAWVSQHPDNFANKARACFPGGTQRPLIELAECDHPLYRDWSNGVPLDRAMGWIHKMNGTA